ncbi:uncharacterized protein BDR25DRAFT_303569 [Lindgomyces ingoldianus]|uniref:Uncharacterized protein n=1 Tax=Lindgomyces ingoldianus TaxID=673940 RepID=A0ACB6QVY5_9PLEO|nr:uncharacterized protein BDR25DRAFT_303569 [Lindgomyces ingoldianus]KAF2471002.1 hypothetical protein BDR25DRAFT_303569 [Lindgomyces ingoldianus]
MSKRSSSGFLCDVLEGPHGGGRGLAGWCMGLRDGQPAEAEGMDSLNRCQDVLARFS